MHKVVGMLCVGVLGLMPNALHGQSASNSAKVAASRSQASRTVTGPTSTMNEAIARGATATITLQPVPPKTVPASNYPPGSSIVGSTLRLGSVPARVWIEGQITGWAPEVPKVLQIKIDGTDMDGDGVAYLGANAKCGGSPAIGAGDLFPAIIPCTSNLDCRSSTSGITTPCGLGEPSRCVDRPWFYPPGGKVCTWGFYDKCDPESYGSCCPNIAVFEYDFPNPRFGWVFDPGEGPVDHEPSYSATMVLDVPANARGVYVMDIVEDETFMLNHNDPPDNSIPIAAVNLAVIQVVGCSTNADCQDNDACTEDVCQVEGCCTNFPVSGWNLATECCNPTNGVQAPIPQSSCRIGGCSLGGSSGSPTSTPRPDGTACIHEDPCYGDGECVSGACMSTQYAGSACPKVRLISFAPDPGSTMRAYRVRMVSLHHPDPPYTGGPVADFSAYEGLYRWVGPSATFVESSANQTPVYAAFVDCDPHYQDWSAIDLLHVSGAEIIPSSVYEVQSIAEGLDTNVESNFSAPITITTARWADVVIPNHSPGVLGQPDFGDISALVDKFRSAPAGVSKPRAKLVGVDASGIPDLSSDVSFSEISAANDAFKGRPYPFSGPIPCP